MVCRQLLTHSSGLGYDVFNPTLAKWRTLRGEPVALSGLPILDRITTPLVYEPGTSWEYSTGIDWAGQMVARVNETDLQSYMQKNMWEPLGITGMTFHLETREDMTARKMEMSLREGETHPMFGTTLNPTGKVVWTKASPWPATLPPGEEFGGAGGYASPAEYLKILHSILASDGKLLKPTTVDEMFKPQLGESSREAFMQRRLFPELNRAMGGLPEGMELDWGIGGLLTLEDLHTGRKKGSMAWGGLPNLIWWVDREGGLAGLSATQVIPPGDPKCCEMHYQWEEVMYEKAKGGSRL
jgi:CubicO group peptidase (beta-lactamase class C family)